MSKRTRLAALVALALVAGLALTLNCVAYEAYKLARVGLAIAQSLILVPLAAGVAVALSMLIGKLRPGAVRVGKTRLALTVSAVVVLYLFCFHGESRGLRYQGGDRHVSTQYFLCWPLWENYESDPPGLPRVEPGLRATCFHASYWRGFGALFRYTLQPELLSRHASTRASSAPS